MISSATSIAAKKRKLFRFTKNTSIEIISALFILLFVYTALSKFVEFGSFKGVLKKSPLIGDMSVLATWAIPTTELLIAALLFIPRTRLAGLYGSLGLMTMFTLYLGYMLAFTPKLPCSCGGVISQMTWTQHLIFNIFFTLLALTSIWLYKKPPVKIEEKKQTGVFT